MKILVLNVKENLELLKTLNREYINEEFIFQIEDVINLIANELNLSSGILHNSFLKNELYKVFVLVIDKIILDNVFRYIVSKNINAFIHLVNNNTFTMDLYINSFYTRQIIEIILKYISLSEEEIYVIINSLNKKLFSVIDQIYLNNSRFLNPILLNLFNSLYESLEFLNIDYYKFELDLFNRPMLIYVEKEKNVCLCN